MLKERTQETFYQAVKSVLRSDAVDAHGQCRLAIYWRRPLRERPLHQQ